METIEKLIKMKVLIVGMKVHVVETAMNFIIVSLHRVDAYDLIATVIKDFGDNFYLIKHHVEYTSRAVVLVEN